MYNINTIYNTYIYIYIYIYIYDINTYNISLAVHKQVALISKMPLLLYIHEQFFMSLHLLYSTILHLWLLLRTTALLKIKKI